MSPWPKLKRDWTGRRCRTLRDLRNNGGDVIRKGRVVAIIGYYRGCQIKTIRKPGAWITRVNPRDLQLLPLK